MTDEEKRLEDLKSYNVLDSSPEEELDELAEIASLICDTPISLITMVDNKRQWFKANKGLKINETPREFSFCQHALHKPKEVLVVNDSHNDKRFKDNPLVTEDPKIRFYAGVPLETPSGNVLGTLCVIDNKPKKISENQEKALLLLGKKAMDFLNVRKIVQNQNLKIESNAEKLKKLTDNIPGGIFQLKMTPKGEMKFEFLSQGMQRLHPSINLAEWKENPEIGYDLIHPEDLPSFIESLNQSYENLSLLYNEYRITSESGVKWHFVKAKPEKLEDGSVIWYGSFQDISNHREYESAMEQIAFDISHVLRKPVTNLLGLTSLIENEKKLTEQNIREYSEFIHSVARELDQFTRDLDKVYRKKLELIVGNKIKTEK